MPRCPMRTSQLARDFRYGLGKVSSAELEPPFWRRRRDVDVPAIYPGVLLLTSVVRFVGHQPGR
jgi:hypothetical protein